MLDSQLDHENLSENAKKELISNIKGIMQGNLKSFNKSINSTDYSTGETYLDKNQQVKKMFAKWTPTKFFRINGIFQFEIGTEESIYFLEHYSESKVNDFVLSNWKYIIDYKWKIIFKRLIFPTVVNWLHGVFFNLAMLYPTHLIFFILDFLVIGVILVYESLSIISSGVIKYIS